MQAQAHALSNAGANQLRSSQGRPTLAVFLELFFKALNEGDVKWCVLRNFDTLPLENVADDIDILIERAQLSKIIRLLGEIPYIVVTSVVLHLHEASVFIGGLECGGLHIDFTFEFAWKGKLFFGAADVLRRAHPYPKWPVMQVADPIDTAMNAFLNTYLSTGHIKERYCATASVILQNHLREAVARVGPYIGSALAMELLAMVAAGNYDGTPLLLSRVRHALIARAFREQPLFSILRTARYYGRELRNCFNGRKCIRIAMFGADGVGKTTLLADLEQRLGGTAGLVRRVSFRPKVVYGRPTATAKPGVTMSSRSKDRLLSFIRPFIWCLDYWLYAFELFRSPSQLLIFDRYFHDIIFAPGKYHCSPWLGRLTTHLVPMPDLLFILHAPAEVVCSRKLGRDIPVGDIEDHRKMTREDTVRYYSACDQFLQRRPNVVVLDATLSRDRLLAHAELSALDVMRRRAADYLVPRQNR
ncbi:MAG TPA: hypothetical protein VG498_09235 [Terriglobales bacterium]|nr:hypothetical protein [Terriglobales bacterium]